MEKKKTIVEMFEQIKAHLTDPAEIEFIEKRIEITQKKNAKTGEPTKAQLAKQAEYAEIETAIVSAMESGKSYTATDLLKCVEGLPEDYNTQRLTPRLTALVEAKKLTNAKVKGRSVYTLVV